MSRRGPEVGNFVLFAGSQGVARIAEVDTSRVLIEYFESAAEPAVGREWMAVQDVKHCRLSAQTRVFFHDSTRWRAGRVVAGGPDTYAVRTPNSETDIRVHESRLRVRWERPPEDPLQVLLAGAHESPYYRDARLPVRDLLLQERAATGSATGVLSAGVELHAHQVNAALRIIQDPIQRYLLADEVGMGKTIQAGFVIRQTLIDDASARVCIIAPKALVSQWRREMLDKFHLDDFDLKSKLGPRPRFKVVAHEDRLAWSGEGPCQLLAVDEAHLLAAVDTPDSEPYASLARLAAEAPRVLLISATPSMQRATTHLALLHLLDPDLYRWSDLERFRGLLEVRRELAMSVFGLDTEPDPDNPELLEYQIEEIAKLIPQDSRFDQLGRDVGACFSGPTLAPGVDQDELNRRVRALRTHVAETYRLHHRVIRNRRHKVIGRTLDDEGHVAPFEVTGRQRPKILRLESQEASTGAEVVEDWLRECSRYLIDTEADPAPYAAVVRVLVSRLGGPTDSVLAVLEARLGGVLLEGEFLPAEADAIAAAPQLVGEEALASRLRDLGRSDGLRRLARSVAGACRGARRSVIFCGPGRLAEDLARQLFADPAGQRVAVHTVSETSGAERAFEEWSASGGILICDHTGDVGQNFQEADAVVHVRVPSHPNALEQRIGRVDRYGHHSTAAQWVVSDADRTGLHTAWLKCLADGFGIFDRSISALQDPIETATADLWSSVVRDGVEQLGQSAQERVRALLEVEFRRVNEMDELEAGFDSAGAAKDPVTMMSGYESDPERLGDAFREVITSERGFRFTENRRLDGSLTFEPSRIADPLLSGRLLTRLATSEATRTGVFDRWHLRRHPNRRLFRRGNPFIDGVEAILELDDRGQASALWRRDPAWAGDAVAFFGFDFLAEADLSAARRVVGDEATHLPPLRRRADAALPPFTRRVWIPANAQESVTDSPTLAVLNRRYARPPDGLDVNMNAHRIAAVHALFGGEEGFALSATECWRVALRELESTTDLNALCGAAALTLSMQATVLAAQAEARRSAGSLVADADALELDRDLARALSLGITRPHVRLLAVTCLVRSSEPWVNYVPG